MKDIWAALGTLLFLIIAPGTVLYFIPFLISHFELQTPFPGYGALRPVGWALILAGLAPLLDSFWRFAIEGLGTPAPLAPTRTLVVSGFYRHVRNPMYVGLVLVLAGEAAATGEWRLLVWGAVVFICSHLFVIGYEEPVLARAYGAQYAAFCAHVPRWLARPRPWRPGAAGHPPQA